MCIFLTRDTYPYRQFMHDRPHERDELNPMSYSTASIQAWTAFTPIARLQPTSPRVLDPATGHRPTSTVGMDENSSTERWAYGLMDGGQYREAIVARAAYAWELDQDEGR